MPAKKQDPDRQPEPETRPDNPAPIVTNTYTAPAKKPVWDVATQGQPPKNRGDYVVIDSTNPEAEE